MPFRERQPFGISNARFANSPIFETGAKGFLSLLLPVSRMLIGSNTAQFRFCQSLTFLQITDY
ncbi:hypothetical protein A3J33_02425 [candidate division WWE3 bacterium RIFCSPLOWO2_02_FULL_53_10]|uniref:Uncharacterized protein n=1 Tax=candidate division WWE3 bacterium RIFCSPLOWO2_02_FULL_53_10 TaxID=1802629 RepID=A0A1F4WLF4_UNCKA|nr:MAG: hypothetical protein A3J33_02425 [candidate division WWE3 bacterium RIFCSPLOWO2_02_FULL_53_10]